MIIIISEIYRFGTYAYETNLSCKYWHEIKLGLTIAYF